MNTTIGERFAQLIEAKKITTNAFANSLGKPYTSLKVIIDGSSKPGYDLLEKVLQTYPEINTVWLMSGEGEMFRPADKPLVDAMPRLTSKSVDGGAFGEQVLIDMAKGLDEIRHVFEEELRAKNRQIDNLQEMLKMAMGSKTPERSFSPGVSCEGRIVPLYSTIEKAVA